MGWAQALAWGGLAIGLAGCGTLDSFSGRVSTINENIASADVDNALRNVVRASEQEPMSFVAVTKVTGNRTSDLKVGLPTLTLGSALTTVQRQAVFGGNITDSSQTYSVELAQLRTDTFTKGLMNPVATSQLENFSHQGFSRELIFYLFVDSIEVNVLAPANQKHTYLFQNAPWLEPTGCDRSASNMDYDIATVALGGGKSECKFRIFEGLVQYALTYGVTVRPQDAKPTVNSQAYTIDLKVERPTDPPFKPPPKPPPQPGAGDFCFDAATVDEGRRHYLPSKFWCSAENPKEHLQLGLGEDGHAITAQVRINLRSPYAIFEYLGQVRRLSDDRQPRLTEGGFPYGGDRRLFPLSAGASSAGCFGVVHHRGVDYCLPNNAYDGKAALKVLILLLQMNTNRTDLPSSAVSVAF